MAHYTVLDAAALAEVAARFGLPPPDRALPEPKGRVNTSYHLWSGGARWFLRIAEGKTEADVAFEAAVLGALGEARFPVPRLVPALDGRPFAPAGGKPAMLFAYAPGEELPRQAAGPERCRRIGEQLGRLHDLASGLLLERENPYGPARVAPWLAELAAGGGLDAEARAALPLLQAEVEAAGRLPAAPRGLVHGDLFLDNVLWVGDRVAAVLDWEMSCTEAFAWDLAVAVDAWCYTDRHEPARARALVEGYRSRRALEPETVAALHPFARYQAARYAVTRLRTFRGAPPAERVAFKDWRRYRDRCVALRAMGPEGYLALLGLAP